MTEVANLEIKVQSGDVTKADRRLGKLAKQGKTTERATDRLRSSFRSVGRSLTVATAAVAAFGGALTAAARATAAEIKELKTLSLLANTGLQEFQDFAFATASVGVSAEKLGDISKDVQDKLGDFIATGGGEFKDFFEEVAPLVGLTAESLQGLAGPDVLIAVKKAMDDANVSAAEQVFFLEAIANDAARLDPLLANNGRRFRELAADSREMGLALSEVDAQAILDFAAASGRLDASLKAVTQRAVAEFAPGLTEATERVTAALAELNAAIESGQLEAQIEAISNKFAGFGEDFAITLDFIAQAWNELFDPSQRDGLAGAANATLDTVTDAFVNFPENIRTIIQLAAIEIGALVDAGREYGTAFGKVLGIEFGKVVEQAEAVGNAIASALNPFDDSDFNLESELRRIALTGADLADEAFSEAERNTQKYIEARRESINAVILEREEAVESFNIQLSKADELRSALDAARAAREDNAASATASVSSLSSPATSTETDDEANARRLGQSIALLNELDAERRHNEELQEVLGARADIFRDAYSIFDDLTSISSNFVGEQNTIFRSLFAASKAFAVAESVVKIQQGIANAAALPFPANLGAIATVTSQTAGIISTIRGTNYAGAFDEGGRIPSGKVGIVGEFGPELVTGPANVTSRKETAEAVRSSADNGSMTAPAPNIRIVNSIDPSVMEDFLGSEEGETLVLNTIRNNPDVVRAVGNS